MFREWSGKELAETLKLSAWIFLFLHFVAAQNALPTQYVTSWHLGNETHPSTVFVVCLGTAGAKSTDSAF